MSSNSAPDGQQAAFRVESPRASDAIGRALSDTYREDIGLPHDMYLLLNQLNGVAGQRAR